MYGSTPSERKLWRKTCGLPFPMQTPTALRLFVSRDQDVGPEGMVSVFATIASLAAPVSFGIDARGGRLSFFVSSPSAEALDVVARSLSTAYPEVAVAREAGGRPITLPAVRAAFRLEHSSAVPLPFQIGDGGRRGSPVEGLLDALMALMQEAHSEEWALFRVKVEPFASGRWCHEAQALATRIAVTAAHPIPLPSSFLDRLVGKEARTVRHVPLADRRLVAAIEEKVGQGSHLTGSVTFAWAGRDARRADQHVHSVAAVLGALHKYGLNALVLDRVDRLEDLLLARPRRSVAGADVFCPEELATLWHPPHRALAVPVTAWSEPKTVPAPAEVPRRGTVLGVSGSPYARRPVAVTRENQRTHMLAIGRSGVGKSTLLSMMALSHLSRGEGVALIDPKGGTTDDVLRRIPWSRVDDVVLVDPADRGFPVGLNPLAPASWKPKHLVCSDLMAIFQRLFGESWGPRLERILTMSLMTLLGWPGATLADIVPLLADDAFRSAAVARVTDAWVREFWRLEFEPMTESQRAVAVQPVLTRVGALTANPAVRNMVCQPKGLDIRRLMDSGKVVLADLAEGKVGEDASVLLGGILVSDFQLAAMSRADTPEARRRPFYLYIDEFHRQATPTLVRILSQARAFNLSLCVANQYLGQLPPDVRSAVLANVGTLVLFALGVEDASLAVRYLSGEFTEQDLVDLPLYHACVRMHIKGVPVKPFTLLTQPLPPATSRMVASVARQRSRRRYGTPREQVEAWLAGRIGRGIHMVSSAAGRPADVDEE